MLLLAGCGGAGGNLPEHKFEVQGDTFRDFTYDCSIRVPTAQWQIEPKHQDLGAAINFLALNRIAGEGFSNAAVIVMVAKYPAPEVRGG